MAANSAVNTDVIGCNRLPEKPFAGLLAIAPKSAPTPDSHLELSVYIPISTSCLSQIILNELISASIVLHKYGQSQTELKLGHDPKRAALFNSCMKVACSFTMRAICSGACKQTTNVACSIYNIIIRFLVACSNFVLHHLRHISLTKIKVAWSHHNSDPTRAAQVHEATSITKYISFHNKSGMKSP